MYVIKIGSFYLREDGMHTLKQCEAMRVAMKVRGPVRYVKLRPVNLGLRRCQWWDRLSALISQLGC